MTWHETIQYIRQLPEYNELVLNAYFHEDLRLNVENYKNTDEFKEILHIINIYAPKAKTILDIGCGNGITSIAFALKGYNVIAVEPDTSDTVGSNAIKKLIKIYNLENKISVYEDFAENLNLKDYSIDVAFARQSMHHANDLNSFVNEMSKGLKKDGLFLTVRDHIVFNAKDKEQFLLSHPLHKFYGGENGYTPNEYKKAINLANLKLIKELKFFDSIINYYPLTTDKIELIKSTFYKNIQDSLHKKIGLLARLRFITNSYIKIRNLTPLNEKTVAGRMYSYIAIKL